MKYLSRRSHEAPEQVAMTKSKATQGVWQVLGIALVYGAVLAVLFAQPALFDAALGVRLLIVLALTGLVFGALVYVRKRTRAALNQAYDVVAERLEGRTQALHDTQDRLAMQIQERQRVEASLHASVDDLRASRDELEAAMLQQAELNERLRASEQQLKDLNVRKDKFFSIVSHDVKSMLVSAIGFSKLLISDAETLPRDMVKEFASHVHSSTTNTYDLLENLLTWTRMQTGRMLYQRAWL